MLFIQDLNNHIWNINNYIKSLAEFP
jgi:hypothetical protein